jgi:cysteine synthase A
MKPFALTYNYEHHYDKTVLHSLCINNIYRACYCFMYIKENRHNSKQLTFNQSWLHCKKIEILSKETTMQVYDDHSLAIGKTPLVKLNRVTGGNVYAKIESRNPSFSVKCRIGANMIWDAEKKGILKPGNEIVEATSGNTGIALAFVAASRGYKITLTMPSSMSLERRKLLKAMGANLVLTEAPKGMKGAIAAANEIVASDPSKYIPMHQFENPANPEIHEKTTGPEIWNDTDGKIDIFIAGVGTGGTITGVSRYIKKTQGKAIITIAVEPTDSPVITQAKAGLPLTPGPHKIQGIGAGFIPGNLDLDLIDAVEQVSNEECMAMTLRLMKEEGILAGISSGAAVVAAKRWAEKPENANKHIVVILASASERYLSSPLFANEFSDSENIQ